MTIFAFFIASCTKESKVESPRAPASVAKDAGFERFTSERLMLTLAGNETEPSKLISLRFSYIGKKGVKDVYEENEDLISNLIRTTIVDYSFKEIQMNEGQQKLEKSILEAINSYIADQQFVEIEVSEFREI